MEITSHQAVMNEGIPYRKVHHYNSALTALAFNCQHFKKSVNFTSLSQNAVIMLQVFTANFTPE